MEELVNLVAAKTGLGRDKAEQAVETVLGFLRDRLPEPIGDQLEDLMQGKKLDLGNLMQSVDLQGLMQSDQIQGLLGGLLGGQQQQGDAGDDDPADDLLQGMGGLFGKR